MSMTKAQKARVKANRQEKRQLRHQLIMQTQKYKNDTPIGLSINLDTSFNDFARKETLREIRNEEIEIQRIGVLEKALKLQKSEVIR